MGNTRGNTYSRNHVSFDPCSSCPDFWNFGFDDTGVKDYSAEIDHILTIATNYEKLHFVGHSMGCTQFVVSNTFMDISFYDFNYQDNINIIIDISLDFTI